MLYSRIALFGFSVSLGRDSESYVQSMIKVIKSLLNAGVILCVINILMVFSNAITWYRASYVLFPTGFLWFLAALSVVLGSASLILFLIFKPFATRN